MEGWTLFLSILGALAWLPTLVEIFIQPVLKAKLIGFYSLSNSEYHPGSILSLSKPPIKGTIFILRLSLVSIKKDFCVSDIRIAVKTTDYETEVEATPYYCPQVIENLNSTTRNLCLEYEENLLFYSSFLKNQRVIGDIMFITDVEVTPSNFQYFNIEFFDNEKMQSIVLTSEEVSLAMNIFDN